MKKTQHKKRIMKKRKTIRKKRGGDCGCNKKIAGPYLPFTGGYGTASYQGGINDSILPLNGQIGTNGDPIAPANISQERFTPISLGGRRKYKKRKGGRSFDLLLGNSTNNTFLGMGTTTGSMNIANGIMGK